MVESGKMEALSGTESEDVLQITQLGKLIRSTYTVQDFTLTLFKNQILVLLGQNGAGKSTLLNMLTR